MMVQFTLAFVLWLGGRLVMSGSISIGQLTTFLLYLLRSIFLGTECGPSSLPWKPRSFPTLKSAAPKLCACAHLVGT
jgi:ABC-type multidrug transport system fused ATPase/permease subunit